MEGNYGDGDWQRAAGWASELDYLARPREFLLEFEAEVTILESACLPGEGAVLGFLE
jgi:hypothetical protein